MSRRKVTSALISLLILTTSMATEGCGGISGSSNPGPADPPPAPSGLTATAGSAQVSLSWTASSGATSYDVKRGTTNGGPYTQIATATTTSYVDSGVSNGTTYYYVATAVN